MAINEPNLTPTVAEELLSTQTSSPETNIFPPSEEHNAEMQIAMLSKLGDLGPLFGRIFSAGDKGLGTAYQKLREYNETPVLHDLDKQIKETPNLEDPFGAAVESLTPAQPKTQTIDTGQPGTGGQIEIDPRTGFVKGLYGWGDGPSTVFKTAQDGEEYTRYITVGDGDMDRIIAQRADAPDMVDGVIGGIRAVGKGGDDKVPDEGHIRNLLGSMAEHIKNKALAGKSAKEIETITLQQLSDMGDLLGHDPEKLKLNFMGGLKIDLTKPGELAAQMIAGKNLLISEIKVLDKLTDEAINLPTGRAKDAARLAWRQQAELVAQLQNAFKGTQTDIARALASLRVQNVADAPLSRDVTAILDNVGGVEKIDAALEAYSTAPSPKDRAALAQELVKPSTKLDAIHEIWINGILSGYWTHVKNTAGVFALMIGDNLETLGAATVQGVTRGLRGEKRDVTFGDARAKMFGQFMALREALVASGRAGWLREDPPMLGQGTKLDVDKGFQNRPDAFSAAGQQMSLDTGLDRFKAGAVDFMGSVLTMGRAPMRLLQAEDAFFKVVAYRGALYEEAYRSGRQLGLEGDEFSTHVADTVFNPPENIAVKAQDTAKMVTLQTEMQGRWKKMQSVFTHPALRWLVPFYKTPTNALLYVTERSPVFYWTNRYRAAIAEGGAEAAKAKIRWQMGSLGMAAIGYHVMQGTCVGGISADRRIRAAYERQGVKPYSCKIGNKWVSYAHFEPISAMMGMVADAIEVSAHPDTEERDALELVAGVVAAIGYNMTNKTFMAGISGFMDAIRDPHRRAENFVRNYVGSAVPGSSFINEIRKLNDNVKRFKIDIVDPMWSKLPGLSDKLGAQRDLWGRPILENRIYTTHQPNDADKVMTDLALPIPNHNKNFGLPGSFPNVEDVEYTVEERDFLLEKAGQLSWRYINSDMKKPAFKKNYKAAMEGDTDSRQLVLDMFRENLQKARKDAFAMLKRHPQLGPGITFKLQKHEFEKNEIKRANMKIRATTR